MGTYVGDADGRVLGAGVGTPATYDGVNVGDDVGTLVGDVEGTGVGFPNM